MWKFMCLLWITYGKKLSVEDITENKVYFSCYENKSKSFDLNIYCRDTEYPV